MKASYHIIQKAFILLLLFFAGFGAVKAQDFVTYNSRAERTLLNSAATPDDYLKLSLLSALNEDDTQILISRINQDLTQMNFEATVGQKPEKRVKQIYESIHDRYLKNYNPNANFSTLFTNGDYDCVTATVLYAYVLEILRIPYQIKQFPAHVYLIAYPGLYDIKLETIDATKGFFVYDDQTKLKMVNQLITANYIDQDYANRVGLERAFDDFFYDKENLTLKEAVSLLYYDKALQDMQLDKTNEAYSDISKSDMLFSDKKNEFFKNDLIKGMLNNLKFDDLEDWRAMTNIVNQSSVTLEQKKYFQFQFSDLLNRKLLNAGQKNLVDQIFNFVDVNVIDTAIRHTIEVNYFDENAHFAYLSNNYTQAFEYTKKAYGVNPNNPIIISQFVGLLSQKFSSTNKAKQNIDSLSMFMAQYPSLVRNPTIRSVYMSNMSVLGLIAFDTNDVKNGEKYLKLITSQLDAYPNHDTNFDVQIARIFGAASGYYFRLHAKQKSIDVLNLGLKYMPNDENLARKLEVNSH